MCISGGLADIRKAIRLWLVRLYILPGIFTRQRQQLNQELVLKPGLKNGQTQIRESRCVL
jgi:hypothetical protein